MKGWILYKKNKQELTAVDHGVNRLLSVASNLGVEIEVYSPDQLELIVNYQKAAGVLLDGVPIGLPDFLLPRLGADTTGHALALIRQLELAGVTSVNSSDSVDMVKDKMRICQLMSANHLPTPRTMLLHFPVSIALVEREIGFPLVIKVNSGARGQGVHLCETATSFQDLLGLLDPYRQQYLVQQFITSSYGRDLRVFVLDGNIAGCMLRTAKNGFKANYSLGGEVSLFPLTNDIKQMALESARLTGLEIAGVDLLFGAKGYFICEINSSPGFKGMELATGEDIATKIIRYCMKACA